MPPPSQTPNPNPNTHAKYPIVHTGSGPQNNPLVLDAQKLLLALKNKDYEVVDMPAGVKLWRLTKNDTTWLTCETQALYERKTCASILKMVKTRLTNDWKTCANNAGVVIGHVPGIGKTMFLNRLLIQLHSLYILKQIEQHEVLFFDRHEVLFLLFNFTRHTVKKVEVQEGEAMIKDSDLRAHLIVLDDPAATRRGPVCRGPAYFAAMCGASNKKMTFAQFCKDAHTPSVTMDPLTMEEAITILLDMHPTKDEDHVRNAYREWGGSLRRLNAALLQNDDFREYENRLEAAFRDFGSHGPTDLDSVPMLLAERIKKSAVSHFIYHEYQNPSAPVPCQSIQLRLASSNIMMRLHDALVKNGRGHLCRFIQYLQPTSPYHWEGFEELMHHNIARGGEVILQQVKGPQGKVPWEQLSEKLFNVCDEYPFKNCRATRASLSKFVPEEARASLLKFLPEEQVA